jgi:AcrR family transcriptional regulator
MGNQRVINIAADKLRKTKATIIERALKIVSIDGLDSLTIGELAKAVGMSKSGLFAHFQGKDHLLLTVLEQATEQFVDQVMKRAFKEPRGIPRIRAFFQNWIHHLSEPSALPGARILISASVELDDRPGALRDYIQKVQRDLIKNLEKAAQMAIDEGHFRKDLDIQQFAWTLYSIVLGYHHFKRMLEDPKAEEHAQVSFEGLLNGSATCKDADDGKL